MLSKWIPNPSNARTMAFSGAHCTSAWKGFLLAFHFGNTVRLRTALSRCLELTSSAGVLMSMDKVWVPDAKNCAFEPVLWDTMASLVIYLLKKQKGEPLGIIRTGYQIFLWQLPSLQSQWPAIYPSTSGRTSTWNCTTLSSSLRLSLYSEEAQPAFWIPEFSGFIELIPDLAADALVQSNSRFGMPSMHVSDQGSHFKDKVIKKFHRILQINHHLTTTHSPGPMEQLKMSITTFRSFSGPFCENGEWNLPNSHFYFLWFRLFWIICVLRLEKVVPLSRSWQASTRSARCL